MQNEFVFYEKSQSGTRKVKPYYLKIEYDDFDMQGTDLKEDIHELPFRQYLDQGHALTIVNHPVKFITEMFVYQGELEQGTHLSMMREEWSDCDVQIYGK